MKWGTIQGSVKHCAGGLKTTINLRANVLSDEKLKVTDNASFNRLRSCSDFRSRYYRHLIAILY